MSPNNVQSEDGLRSSIEYTSQKERSLEKELADRQSQLHTDRIAYDHTPATKEQSDIVLNKVSKDLSRKGKLRATDDILLEVYHELSRRGVGSPKAFVSKTVIKIKPLIGVTSKKTGSMVQKVPNVLTHTKGVYLFTVQQLKGGLSLKKKLKCSLSEALAVELLSSVVEYQGTRVLESVVAEVTSPTAPKASSKQSGSFQKGKAVVKKAWKTDINKSRAQRIHEANQARSSVQR